MKKKRRRSRFLSPITHHTIIQSFLNELQDKVQENTTTCGGSSSKKIHTPPPPTYSTPLLGAINPSNLMARTHRENCVKIVYLFIYLFIFTFFPSLTRVTLICLFISNFLLVFFLFFVTCA